jgi:hypothetical protein
MLAGSGDFWGLALPTRRLKLTAKMLGDVHGRLGLPHCSKAKAKATTRESRNRRLVLPK